MTEHYFNYPGGWENTNPGWYEVRVKTKDRLEHLKVVEWIYQNIDKCEKHCRWTYNEEESMFRFRYERDCIWFRLSW